MKAIFIFIQVFFFSTCVFGKPRPVFLDTQLKSAKFIGVVVIDSYDGEVNIYFHSIEYPDTIAKAFANFKGPGGSIISPHAPGTLEMTGYWPYQKDTLLIVIDSTSSVSLFAKVLSDRYRFWSPYFTGSIARFYFIPPAYALNPADERIGSFNKADAKAYHSCWDGCYLNKQDLKRFVQ